MRPELGRDVRFASCAWVGGLSWGCTLMRAHAFRAEVVGRSESRRGNGNDNDDDDNDSRVWCGVVWCCSA